MRLAETRTRDLRRDRSVRLGADDLRRVGGRPAGIPDLLLVRRGRVVACELKAERGRVSADQLAWLHDLAADPQRDEIIASLRRIEADITELKAR
jgi:hypothetical protein